MTVQDRIEEFKDVDLFVNLSKSNEIGKARKPLVVNVPLVTTESFSLSIVQISVSILRQHFISMH
jgi:hypothetical protein